LTDRKWRHISMKGSPTHGALLSLVVSYDSGIIFICIRISQWLSGFIRRHSEVSLLKPEATGLGRITRFSEAGMNIFCRICKIWLRNTSSQVQEGIAWPKIGYLLSRLQTNFWAERAEKITMSQAEREVRHYNLNGHKHCWQFLASKVHFSPTKFYFGERRSEGLIYRCSRNGQTN
jgi:hypothetical protein